MAALVEWYTHAFRVSPDSIRVFNDLSVSGTCETEEKESGKEKYVSLKNRKPAEITLTAILDARLGCDVRNEVMTYINEAQKGTSDYIYANGGKLIGCKMMLTSAKASKIEIAPMGKWAYAQVVLTFKQATKEDGSTGSSGGSGSSGGGSSSGSSSSGSKKTTSLKLISTVQDMVEVNSVFADAAVAKTKQAAVEYANSQAAKDAAKAALISSANKITNPATTLKALSSSFSSKSSSSSSTKTSSAASKVSSVSTVVKKVSATSVSNKVVAMKK